MNNEKYVKTDEAFMLSRDNKLRLLVDKLCDRKVLNEQDKQDLLKLEPFPQLHL